MCFLFYLFFFFDVQPLYRRDTLAALRSLALNGGTFRTCAPSPSPTPLLRVTETAFNVVLPRVLIMVC